MLIYYSSAAATRTIYTVCIVLLWYHIASHSGLIIYQVYIKQVILLLMAHSYRGAFFLKIPLFGNNWRYVSIYGGVLSLFVKFSRSKNIKFVNIPTF